MAVIAHEIKVWPQLFNPHYTPSLRAVLEGDFARSILP